MNKKENRKHYYLYKTTCLVNDKIYIGIHKTDNLNDGYLGSGVLLRRAIKKYGKENFKKEIINFYDSYEECLNAEECTVPLEFIALESNYNLRTGGLGGEHGIETKKLISEKQKENWENNKEKIMTDRYENGHYDGLGEKLLQWQKDNPQKHKERMDKINLNPVKIDKTAVKHRGMKRSETAKSNISEGRKKVCAEKGGVICGKGMLYVTNVITKELKRVPSDYILLENEVFGNDSAGKSIKGNCWYYHPITRDMRCFQLDTQPDGYIKGRIKTRTNSSTN